MKPKERLLNACLNKDVDRPPVWMMRQAGRYLPEYRSVKTKHSTKEMMTTPNIAAKITLQPIDILNVDAAIIYSDILMLPDAMGMGLQFIAGEGPSFDFCINDCDSLNRLQTEKINKKLSYVFETIKLCIKKLPSDFPLIGFAGGPFTVACYMIHGRGKPNISKIKTFAWTQPKIYEQLLSLLTETTIAYLKEQAKHGVSVVQVFDTWAGELSSSDYETLVAPYSKKIFYELQQAYIPSIHYVLNSNHLMKNLSALSSDTIGIDWHSRIEDWKQESNKHAIQGNLDPDALLTTPNIIETQLKDMISKVENPCKGYIINLGHGIKPETPVKNAKSFVDKAKKLFQ